MARVDYLSDDNGDIRIENGDLVKGESDFDHIRKVITTAPGGFRQFPDIGFNAIRFKNAQHSKKAKFESELRESLQADGYKVLKVDLSQKEWWKDFTVNVE